MFRFHRFPSAIVTFHSDSTLATHSAVEGRERGFCRNCGSFLFYRRQTGANWINFAVGCFDKDALANYGTILTQETGNLWCCNEIPGVTDHLRGDKYDTE